MKVRVVLTLDVEHSEDVEAVKEWIDLDKGPFVRTVERYFTDRYVPVTVDKIKIRKA